MYGDAAGFVAYHEARGRSLPATWDDDSINAALLAASEWIDNIYGSSFIGYKSGGFLQAREWPRKSAVVECSIPAYLFGEAEIPDRVENATYEAAYRQMVTPGSLQVDYTPGKYKKVSIDGALSVEYAQIDVGDIQVQIAAVDSLLWPLLDKDSPIMSSSLSGGAGRV